MPGVRTSHEVGELGGRGPARLLGVLRVAVEGDAARASVVARSELVLGLGLDERADVAVTPQLAIKTRQWLFGWS